MKNERMFCCGCREFFNKVFRGVYLLKFQEGDVYEWREEEAVTSVNR